MQYTSVSALLVALLASNAIAAPLAQRTPQFGNFDDEAGDQSLVGQARTDGQFDGTCRADGRCGLEIPPNEISFQFVKGQCESTADNANAGAGAGAVDDVVDDDEADDNTGNDVGNTGSVAGQSCTDGTFDGTCRADGRCGLEIPPNEVSFQFVSGQCETAGGNADADAGDNASPGGNTDNNGNDGNAGNTNDNGNTGSAGNTGNAASFEGQACTDGTFDGFCGADGRCGLNIPPNEFSRQFVRGQCGR
ncbi:hypothetical protein GGS26DRAFT_561630 [Hypomontagnella submonticulosa]|nr:hypothetical protein GGS26DRAFT_561630 [Hypomontagnella submonticulosa]